MSWRGAEEGQHHCHSRSERSRDDESREKGTAPQMPGSRRFACSPRAHSAVCPVLA